MTVTRLIPLLLFLSYPLFSQSLVGTVSDLENEQPIPFVHIRTTDQQFGVVTDAQGQFQLDLKEGIYELHFSSIGFIDYYKKIDTDTLTSAKVEILMIPDQRLLSEVFVYTKRFNLLEKTRHQPLRIAGLPTLDHPQPIESGTWKWGWTHYFNNRHPSLPVVPLISGVLYGPFSYFSAEDKEKRALKNVLRKEHAFESYYATLHDQEYRQQMIKALNLSEKEYDSLLVLFNQQGEKLLAQSSKDNAGTQLFIFLQEHSKRE